MNSRIAVLFYCILSLTSCKKEKVKELYPVQVNSDEIVFSNLNNDTVALDFATVRIKQAHILANGVHNDGFALSKALAILPNTPLIIPKQQFTYFNLDTLKKEDILIRLTYNIREFPDSPARGIVKTFSKDF